MFAGDFVGVFFYSLIFTFNLSVCVFFSSFLLLVLSGEFLLPNTCVMCTLSYICVLHTLNFIFCMRPYVCNFILMLYRIVYIERESCVLYIRSFYSHSLVHSRSIAFSCPLCVNANLYRFLVIIIQETSRFLCCIVNY